MATGVGRVGGLVRHHVRDVRALKTLVLGGEMAMLS